MQKLECQSEWAAEAELDRIDDDTEDERQRGHVRLLLSTVEGKPWIISVEDTDKA